MNKKVFLIYNISVISLYTVIEILYCFGAEYLLSLSPAVLFSGTMVLLTALPTLSPQYRKTRKLFLVLAIIDTSCAVVFSVFFSKTQQYHVTISICTAVFAFLVVGVYFGLILIDAYKGLLITKITSGIGIIVSFLNSLVNCSLCIKYCYDMKALSASAAMVTCSIAINLMAPKLRNKTVQIILSIGSLAFLVLPAVYLIRGYWGFSGEAIAAIAIASVLIALVCTIITAIAGMRQETNAPETAAPAFAAPTGIYPAPAVNSYHSTPQAPAPTAKPYQPMPQAPAPMANAYQPTTPHQAPVNVWTCPGCGNVNTDGVFCGNCGNRRMAPVAQNENSTWTCPKCGNTPNTGKFCVICGYKKNQTV